MSSSRSNEGTVKNALTLELSPALAEAYDVPPGKQTHISTHLRCEA